ncbi:MAG: hypothetical protein AABY86_03480 [Bdellovibrionota bacterium]
MRSLHSNMPIAGRIIIALQVILLGIAIYAYFQPSTLNLIIL